MDAVRHGRWRGSRWRAPLLALALYAVLVVVMTWPMAARLNTHLFGRGSDAWSHFWIFWWVKDSLVHWHSPFFTDLLYYPAGVPLYTQNIAWANIGLWLVLQLFMGELAAYNVAFMLVYWLNAAAMFFLIRELVREDGRVAAYASWAAFVGGLIYGFWPYIQRHSFHPNLSLTAAIPLALLFLHRLLKNGRTPDALLAGLFIALIGITRWQLLIMAAILLGAFVLYEFVVSRAARSWRMVGQLALVGAFAGLLMLPFAAPVAVYQLTRDHPEDIYLDEQYDTQTDLLAYVLPSHAHPLWGEAMTPFYDVMPENFSYTPFIGFVTLLLALWGLAQGWPHTRFWLLAALLFFMLALGPELQVNGRLYPAVPMPYSLVENNPLIRLLRNPDRFNVLLGMPVAVLAAFGVADLLRRLRWRPVLVVGALSLLILFEYSEYPFPSQDTAVSPFYTALASEPGDFGIVELPIQPRGADKQHMFYQTGHRKPIVGGHISRIPREAYAFISQNALLNSLVTTEQVDPAIGDVSRQLNDMAEAGFRYLVIDNLEIPPAYKESVQAWLTIEPIYEDERVVVYRTAPEAGRDFQIAQPLTTAVGLIHSGFIPPAQTQAAEFTVDVRWGATAVPGKAYDVCFDWLDADGRSAQQTCAPLSPSWPTADWGANEVVKTTHDLAASPYLPGGTYTLTLSLRDQASGLPDGQPAVIGRLPVQPQPREFALPTPETETAVQWADAIRLLGFDLDQGENTLDLTVYWQALARMDADYTVFVHLLDENGQLVAQNDARPRRSTYPTAWWEAGEVVADTIPLDLTAVPPGAYTLTIGLYELATGERATAVAPHQPAFPNNEVPLATIVR